MAKYTLSKYDTFKIKYFPILIPVVVILMLAAMFGYMLVNGGEKTPATCEEVSRKLAELGYDSVDVTDSHRDEINSLRRCIYTQKDNLEFFFFELNDFNSAFSLHASNNSQISMKGKYNDWSEHHDNYSRYSLLTYDDIYYDSVLVENTVVYARCSNENKEELYKIITAIKYNASTKENRED